MDRKVFHEEKLKNSKAQLIKNTVSSVALQAVTIICGFIVPRKILESYGSEVNGLVNSITQFLSVISFLELGVGAVVQTALYRPLAEHDKVKTSEIVASATRFFHRLGRIFLCYIAVLICVYPLLAKQNFGWLFTAMLIIAMSISTTAQYYFGIVDRLLLSADQRGYIHYTIQIVTLILNTVACVFLIHVGASIHFVKLTTSIIYLTRPLFLRLYINRYYQINREIQYADEPIQQKWNGIAQHIAAIILDATDTIVLTLFSSLVNVSIYSVYHLIINGVKQLLMSINNGVHSLCGELWAKGELEKLRKTFGWYEWTMHTMTTFAFGCTETLILPFIKVYTGNIIDVEYIQPLFASLLVSAYAFFSYRNPYAVMILAAGHYKQTQTNYIIAAGMNIVISVAVVSRWGLVGVAVGTLAAMAYQTVWMAAYNARNLLHWPFKNFCRQLAADGLTVLLAVPICRVLPLSAENYVQWVMCAIPVATIWLLCALIVNFFLYREKLLNLLGKGMCILKLRG